MNPDHRTTIARITSYFEALTPQSVAQIGDFYSPDASFKDPFNQVRGLVAITRVFEHMFVALQEPRFVVTEQLVDGAQAFSGVGVPLPVPAL